jgi:PadR family transcriptional regulator, regulatory protein PadR
MGAATVTRSDQKGSPVEGPRCGKRMRGGRQGPGCGVGERGCGLRGGGDGGGSGQHRRVLLETALLLCLVEDRAHGYSLMEAVDVLVGGQVCVDPGSVYRLLRSMEEAGCVESSWQPGPAGPSRRIYAITEDGRAALAEASAYLDRRAQMLGVLASRVREALMVDKAEASVTSAADREG